MLLIYISVRQERKNHVHVRDALDLHPTIVEPPIFFQGGARQGFQEMVQYLPVLHVLVQIVDLESLRRELAVDVSRERFFL